MRTESMMNKASTSPTIPVSDLYLTAYLICQGMEFLRADPHNPHRVTFLLKDSPARARLVEDFYGRRAKVDPIAFKSVIIDLKSIAIKLMHGNKFEIRIPPLLAGEARRGINGVIPFLKWPLLTENPISTPPSLPLSLRDKGRNRNRLPCINLMAMDLKSLIHGVKVAASCDSMKNK